MIVNGYTIEPGANLRGADLRRADLRSVDLGGADLSGADLMGASIGGANLRGTSFMGANLMGVNFIGADLRGSDLRYADLRGTNVYIYQCSRYVAYYTGGDMLRIGCEYHSITYWLEHYAEIGKKNSYTEQEVLESKRFIDMVADIHSSKGDTTC